MRPGYAYHLPALALFSASLVCAPCIHADDSKFSLSTGFDLTANKYETGPWKFRLDTPFGLTGETSPPSGVSSQSLSDLSNTQAAATYNLYEGSAYVPEIDFTGKVKINAYDTSKVFGVNQNDYSAQMDVYQSVDRFTAKGSVGSRVMSSPISGLVLSPLLYGSFGGIYQFSRQTSTGVDMNLAQDPLVNGMKHEISAYVNYKLDNNFGARGYVLRGLSSGNQNSTLGGLIYYGF